MAIRCIGTLALPGTGCSQALGWGEGGDELDAFGPQGSNLRLAAGENSEPVDPHLQRSAGREKC